MKKICYFIALLALIILPIKVNAETVIEYEISNPDANGVYTVQIYQKVGSDTTINTFNATIIGQHCLIQSVTGTDLFTTDATSSPIDATGTSAQILTTYANGVYTGTGEKIKVAQFTYIHDPNYSGDEEFKVTLSTPGSTDVIITEKTTANAKTGSALPYVGLAAGIVLVASAYVISRKTTKLYRM